MCMKAKSGLAYSHGTRSSQLCQARVKIRDVRCSLIVCVCVWGGGWGVGRSSTLKPLPVETRSFLLVLKFLFLSLTTCPSGLDPTCERNRNPFMPGTCPLSSQRSQPPFLCCVHSVNSTHSLYCVQECIGAEPTPSSAALLEGLGLPIVYRCLLCHESSVRGGAD